MSASRTGASSRAFHSIVTGLLALFVPLGSGPLSGQQADVPPTRIETLFQSGLASLKERKFQEAEEAFRKLHELEPASPRGVIGVAEVYMAQKREDEAIRLLQEEGKKNPRNLGYRMALGSFAMRAAKYNLSLDVYLKLLPLVDKSAKSTGELYYRIGEVYRLKGDLDFSVIFLRQAKDLLPGNGLILGTLGLVLDKSGHKEEAVKEYQAVLAVDPNAAPALNNLAFLFADNGGDLDLALTYAKRARELAPNLAEASDTLGWVYVKKNMPDEAIGIFRELLQKDPTQPTYRYHLGAALELKGDHAAAREELETALKGKPSSDEEQKIKALLQKIPQ